MNHDEFDQFLQDNADGLRMHPSDKVWKHIAAELDRKKKRSGGLFVLALLLISGTYIAFELAQTNHHIQLAQQNAPFTPILFQPADLTRTQSNQTVVITNNRTRTQTISKTTQTPSQGIQENASADAPAKLFEDAAGNGLTLPEQTGELSLAEAPVAATGIRPYNTDSLAEQPAVAATITAPVAEAEELPLPESMPSLPKPIHKSRKLSWQVFAAPTVSYRVLSDNKAYQRPLLSPGIPANFSALYSINDVVIHKPDLGLEFGITARYPVSRSVNLRTGFQFNVSRYDIKAFSYVPEVATIALNNGPHVDSVRAISNYRNFAGGIGDWLQNFYFQASIPIGLEWKVASTRKMHWSVASSIQPSYVLGNRSYMITADYKNYARVPWLTRRWNMNTSFESFVSFNSGKTQWQIGPQVRYQVLSSFIKEYPVKENLFDFGMKVGITIK